jgi:hypothetical protein
VPNVFVDHGYVHLKRRFRQVCKRHPPKPKPDTENKPRRKAEVALLKVSSKGGGQTVFLEAIDFLSPQNPVHSRGSLAIGVYERHEEVRIARKLSTMIDHDSFTLSGPYAIPETIAITLPEPFAGNALYSHRPGSPSSWTGDLSVGLPGGNRVPLTGPGFSAVLCRGSLTSRLKSCR